MYEQKSKPKMKFIPTGRLKSFVFAFRGLRIMLSGQKNFLIHLAVTFLVIFAGLFAGLTNVEWCIIIAVIILVLALEIINTALEKLVDFISPGFHEQAGAIKDLAAAAVLIAAIGSVIIGSMIFLPKIL
jgi:diacylglycerol kinase